MSGFVVFIIAQATPPPFAFAPDWNAVATWVIISLLGFLGTMMVVGVRGQHALNKTTTRIQWLLEGPQPPGLMVRVGKLEEELQSYHDKLLVIEQWALRNGLDRRDHSSHAIS